MNEKTILKYLSETEALLEGHFELRSKLHSDRYFQCANLLRFPRIAGKLCKALTDIAVKSGKLGKRIDGVLSPAVGGILVGHEVARALDTQCIFAEKVQDGTQKDAAGQPLTKLAMRRFAIKKGARYIVAEDVITKGGRVQETIDLIKNAGASVAGVLVIVDRSAGKVKFGRIPVFSLLQMTPTVWKPEECPLCAGGSKPVHPGS